MKLILHFAICLFFVLNIQASELSSNKHDSEFFFAIDKSRHNSKAERDIYEKTLLDQLASMLYEMSNNPNLRESNIADLSNSANDLLSIINTIRDFSDKFINLSTEPVQSLIKEQYPDIDIEVCYASNGERYSLIEFAQLANCSIDMFEILNKTTRLYYSIYQECLLNEDCDKDGSTSAKLKKQTTYRTQKANVIAEKTVHYTELLQAKVQMIDVALTLDSE